MPDREPSAAEALFGHLKSGTPEIVQQRQQPASVADAMYPRPKPAPKNPYLTPMTETEWRDQFFEMCGLRRKR